jgi:hypothetical protein
MLFCRASRYRFTHRNKLLTLASIKYFIKKEAVFLLTASE